MVSTVAYVVLPLLIALGLIRKYRQSQWGTCKDFKSLQGKVFVVTGANSGIGKETVRGLAVRKARVILACRDMDNAYDVIADIRKSVSTGELIPMKLDLACLKSVHNFVEDVNRDFPKIHTLINNAGVSVPVSKNMKTEDGFEINFGVNHLGHFLLTKLLIPKLIESSPSRVVIVMSSLHEHGKINFDNLTGEHGWEVKGRMNPAYANSKLANAYFCQELSRKLKGSGVEVMAVCPGFCYTRLFRHSNLKWWQYIIIVPVVFVFMRSAAQGAQTVLHCAVSDEVAGMSGEFFRDCKRYRSKFKFLPDVASKLWDVSDTMVSKELK